MEEVVGLNIAGDHSLRSHGVLSGRAEQGKTSRPSENWHCGEDPQGIETR